MFVNLGKYLPLIIIGLSLFCLAALFSLILSKFLVYILPRLGFVVRTSSPTLPDASKAIPRGVGLGFILSHLLVLLIACLVFPLISKQIPFDISLPKMLPLLLVFPLGILSDRFRVPFIVKEFCFAAIAILAWKQGFHIATFFGVALPLGFSFILTVLWITFLMSLFCLLGSIDGLVGSLATVAGICQMMIAVSCNDSAAILFISAFIGAIVGFLFFHWVPDKVITGNAGAMYIGLVIALVSISLDSYVFSLVPTILALLVCGISFFDLALVTWKNEIQASMKPQSYQTSDQCTDPEQFNKKVLQNSILRLFGLASLERLRQFRQKHSLFNATTQRVRDRIHIIEIAMALATLLACFIPDRTFPLAFIIILLTFSWVIRQLSSMDVSGDYSIGGFSFHSMQMGFIISHAINPLFDLAVITVSTITMTLIAPMPLHAMTLHIFIIMATLFLTRAYKTIWSFSVSDDYFQLVAYILLAHLLSFLFQIPFGFTTSLPAMVYSASLIIACMLTERLFFHYLFHKLGKYSAKFTDENTTPEISTFTLLCGITPEARLYNHLLQNSSGRSSQERIVGILTTKRQFLNQYCLGMKVLGGIEDLPDLFEQLRFNRIIVTSELNEMQRDAIRAFAAEKRIEALSFSTQTSKL